MNNYPAHSSSQGKGRSLFVRSAINVILSATEMAIKIIKQKKKMQIFVHLSFFLRLVTVHIWKNGLYNVPKLQLLITKNEGFNYNFNLLLFCCLIAVQIRWIVPFWKSAFYNEGKVLALSRRWKITIATFSRTDHWSTFFQTK